jgi:sec-independent protein translocase protein TatB
MFDLGIQELIVIFLVALVVLGPKKLPELGKTLGKVVREMKKALHEFKDQVDPHIIDPYVNSFKEPFQNVVNPINDLMHVSIPNEKSKDSANTTANTTEIPKTPQQEISKDIVTPVQARSENIENKTS